MPGSLRRPLWTTLCRNTLLISSVLAAGLVCSTASVAHAQAGPGGVPAAGTIVGRVVDDASGEPVEGVAVVIDGPDRAGVVSTADGTFRFSGVAAGIYEMKVSHIAYGEATHLVNVPPNGEIDLTVRLVPRAIALDSIVVSAHVANDFMLRGGYFDRKRTTIGGTFLEGRDLKNGGWASTILAGGVPSIVLESGRSGFDRVVAMRVSGRECIPDLFLDGMPVLGYGGHLDDWVYPEDIQAVEVYRGMDTPPEFVLHPGFRPCGAIVVWRKRLAQGGS